MMQAVLTYCSRKKAFADRVRVPAYQRYAGKHITLAHQFALAQQRELYFLSGMYGFIYYQEPIINYDMRMGKIEPTFVAQVGDQIRRARIADIIYLTEGGEELAVYDGVVRLAQDWLAARNYPLVLVERDFTNLEGL